MKTLQIAIEGMSGAGKTALIDMLVRNNRECLCHRESDFPQINYSAMSILDKQKEYLKAEALKFENIKEGYINIFDRSFLSVLAYSFALEKIGVGEKGIYKATCKLCKESLDQNIFTKPDLVFVMLVDKETSIKRRKNTSKESSDPMMLRDDFLNALLYFYKNIDWKEFTKGNIISVEADSLEMDQIYKKLTKAIEELA